LHKKKRSKSIAVFASEGIVYSTVHSDDQHAWIVEFDMARKNVGGIIKKVPKSFLDSKEISILAL
tara:strand:+ start:120 stop:314 length:195 start_codon:yes stop_codon:yes gene_type:complete